MVRARFHLIVDVLIEKREFIVGPAITLLPQLFSLPLFLSSFIFNCQNIESSRFRYFLIGSYWISLTPQWTSFFLYISPSSFYSNEWRKTSIHRWLNTFRCRHLQTPSTTFTGFSIARDTAKDQH